MKNYSSVDEVLAFYADAPVSKQFGHLWHLVGNTPMVEIVYLYKGAIRRVYAKCEHYNLTGSVKDRMALYILQKAYEHFLIKKGDIIVEATSGNSGISFGAIGKALGHEVKIIMPQSVSRESVDIIKSVGAETLLLDNDNGDFKTCIALSQQMAKDDNRVFLPAQFDNLYNCEAHERTTAKEIWMQLQGLDLEPDAFVGGVGTGGTVMGMSRYFKKRRPAIMVHPLEPAANVSFSAEHKTGSHRIKGIFDEFTPSIVRPNELDAAIQVFDGDAILMAQKLASQLGLGVGISSGANFIGALQLQNAMGDGAVVVTIFCDNNKKYLSTDLMKEEPVREEYYSKDVELLEYRAVKSYYGDY